MSVASEIKHLHALSILWPENKMIKKKELGYKSVVETNVGEDKGEEGMLSGIESKALWLGRNILKSKTIKFQMHHHEGHSSHLGKRVVGRWKN